MKRVCYLGWLGHNNAGDELMWEVFQELDEMHLNKYKLIPFSSINGLENLKYDVLVLGGGSLLVPRFINQLYSAVRKKKKIIIWGSGLDWIAKKKLRQLIHNKGRIGPILRPDVRNKLAQIIRHARFVGVRGPLTYLALQQMGINMRKVRISGDSGMLLNKHPDQPLPPDSNLWEEEAQIIAVNWGTSFDRIYGNNETAVEDQLVNALRHFIGMGYKIYIYTVWDQDIHANTQLYERLGDHENVRFSAKVYHYNDFINILSRCAFSINFKLHANMLSAAASIPFIALGYRFKVFDFAYSIGLEHMIVPTDSKQIEKKIIALEDFIKNNREQIVSMYEDYKTKFHKNLIIPIRKKYYLLEGKNSASLKVKKKSNN